MSFIENISYVFVPSLGNFHFGSLDSGNRESWGSIEKESNSRFSFVGRFNLQHSLRRPKDTRVPFISIDYTCCLALSMHVDTHIYVCKQVQGFCMTKRKKSAGAKSKGKRRRKQQRVKRMKRGSMDNKLAFVMADDGCFSFFWLVWCVGVS